MYLRDLASQRIIMDRIRRADKKSLITGIRILRKRISIPIKSFLERARKL